MFGRLLTSDDEESTKTSLDDEFDDSGESEIVGGQLSFKEGENAPDKYRSWSGGMAEGRSSPRQRAQRVAFEIVSAKTISDAKKKYVSYTVLVKRSPGLETRPGVVERRYSDFLALYQALRVRQPSLLSDFPFPRKALLGNFSADVIGERSAAFQHLLALAHSVRELRSAPELCEFLHRREGREAHAMMRQARFEDAALLLENVYFVQEKVLEEGSHATFHTLCLLVACLNALDNVEEAQRYAALALDNHLHPTSPLTPPLLALATRLWWATGRDKRALEARLATLRPPSSATHHPTLLEMVLHPDCPDPTSSS